jgi:hypothetical protein
MLGAWASAPARGEGGMTEPRAIAIWVRGRPCPRAETAGYED